MKEFKLSDTLKQMATKIAEAANACCNRTDGFQQDIEQMVLLAMETAYFSGKMDGHIEKLLDKP